MSDATTVVPSSILSTASTEGLPPTYVETDAVECNTAKMANFLGIFGILGTGIYYAMKKNTAGPFAKDQMKEAFNFHLLVFVVAIALSIISSILANIVGILGMLVGLVQLAVSVGAIVLSIMNGLKAGKGFVARYPARLRVLK